MLDDLRAWWTWAPKPTRIMAAVFAVLFVALLLLAALS